jgi:hypothetical protein
MGGELGFTEKQEASHTNFVHLKGPVKVFDRNNWIHVASGIINEVCITAMFQQRILLNGNSNIKRNISLL